MVHASYDDSLHCHSPALKPLPDLCVVDLMDGESKVDVESKDIPNGQSLLFLEIGLGNQRPVLAPWNQLSLGLPLQGKSFCHTQMTW